MAKKRDLVAVMDFSLVEVSNQLFGSVVTSGADRLEGAGASGVPQMVAPGGVTLVDFQSWKTPPVRFSNRDVYAHNRLIGCVRLSADERVEAANAIAAKLNKASAPTVFIMPRGGIDEWDKPGGPFHDADGLRLFADTIRDKLQPPVELIELEAHINDEAFSAAALKVLDGWIASGVIEAPSA